MSVGRGVFLSFLFCAVSVCVIGLRGEQLRLAARTSRWERERLELKRKAWSLEVEIGRLRNPVLVRERVVRWELELFENGLEEVGSVPLFARNPE